MRKSIFLLIALLISANTVCNAEEIENKATTDTTTNKTEVAASTDKDNDSGKVATTETSEATDSANSDEKKASEDSDKEKDNSKESSSESSTTVTSDKTNPFSEDSSVSVTAAAEPTKISDTETAKAAGIEKIADGYPKSGTLDALGGDRLRLRSWPWGNVIGNYYAGTSVEILGESGEFYLVNINGTQGYMHKNYITTSDKAASGVSPYYPGDTQSGGSLSLEEGVKASKDGAAGKVPTVVSSDSGNTNTGSTSSTPGTVTKNGKYVCMEIQKLCQMTTNTPAPGSACGPTSVSMVLSYYGKGDAAKIVSNVYKISGCTAANGTGHDGLAKAAKSYGLNASWHYSSTQAWCREQLEAGRPLVCHVNHHYVVMKGMDANGNVIINDPAKSVVERKMSWSEFAAWWNKSNAPMSCMVCN